MMRSHKTFIIFLISVTVIVTHTLLNSSLNKRYFNLPDFRKKWQIYAGQLKWVLSGQVSPANTMIMKGPHPTTEPGIIFLQTSTELNPSPLVMCSIESAARLNPNKPVYFFMKAFTGNVSAYREPEYKGIPLLSSFKNVIILPLNPEELFNNTPLAGWYEKVDPSKEEYWIHVLSDGCRLALLWKYGGIYLDTDTISLKPLEFQNFIVAQSANYASNGILGFNRSHPFLENCLTDFVEKYNGAVWGQQGPTLITKNLQKWCGTDLLDQFLNKECKGIGYVPNYLFYPIPHTDWKQYFEKYRWNNNNDAVEKEFSKSNAVHVWNFLSGRQKYDIKGSQSLIEYFYQKYCPSTYGTLSN
ncbi:alpha-1,4-N-acetylglucosaminyltransferase-like [Chiloscyllium plagiosum]|uniref:alpha-1,4-N-acetylglucosaminyltransferase-like n=1 Tax=Chiloscyllium plagiosum TaxID=36176 RepID=UPI001CB8783B|nr:alpha-1,4-N-acetylglucosaminyltransferase-like [Chiloscyllium plagiosum]